MKLARLGGSDGSELPFLFPGFPVWDHTIGGYQVIKKWLSYLEKDLLGRGFTPDEVRHVTEMARRFKALIALQPALDENYRNGIKATYPWPK